MIAVTPASRLRKAEAISQDGPDFLTVRELVEDLRVLTSQAEKEPQP